MAAAVAAFTLAGCSPGSAQPAASPDSAGATPAPTRVVVERIEGSADFCVTTWISPTPVADQDGSVDADSQRRDEALRALQLTLIATDMDVIGTAFGVLNADQIMSGIEVRPAPGMTTEVESVIDAGLAQFAAEQPDLAALIDQSLVSVGAEWPWPFRELCDGTATAFAVNDRLVAEGEDPLYVQLRASTQQPTVELFTTDTDSAELAALEREFPGLFAVREWAGALPTF